MAETKTCPDCGATLPADAPEGFCPQCLMAAGEAGPSQAGETPSRMLAAGFPVSLGELEGVEAPPARFGDYELHEEIAHGGMGVVYKARQRSLDRTVAVKMILAGQFATKEFVRRFRAEAATAAVLQHPNIVAIHEVGIHDGRHFFSMDYVEGQNLAQLVGQRPLSAHQAARYLQLIAEAVHYAHEQGILHRDLKPSNVLIDSSTDQPRITDFGLARRLEGESSLTLTGQVLGSPNFMPPEQAGEGHGKLGRHSDVYGLGAILYYLITARAPFQAETLGAIVTQVLDAEPIPPRLLNPAVPHDLETICLKCLEKEPSRRYQTAKELAEELGRFREDKPIHARPVGRTARCWRWCRRKPALATLGAIASALLLVVLIGAPIALVRIQRARVEAEWNLYAADMKLVSEAVQDGAYNHARELLERHRPKPGQADLRGFEWRYFWKVLEDHEPIRTLEGLPATTGWTDSSLITRGDILYNLSGSELRAWDMRTWERLPLTKPPLQSWVEWIWNPETGTACAADNTNAELMVYRLPKFDKGPTVRLPGPVSKIALSRDGEVLALAAQLRGKHRVILWDVKRDAQLGEFGEYDAGMEKLLLSPDGTILAVLSTHGALGLWSVRTGKVLSGPPDTGAHRHIDFIEFFPDSTRLLFGADDGAPLHIWDIRAEAESVLARGGVKQFAFHGFSPGGNHLLTAVNRQELSVFNARTVQLIGTLKGHLGLVGGTGYSPDGKLLATASVDQTARVWDLASLREVAVLGGFGERISDIKFSPDGQSIILVTGFGGLKVYDRSTVVNRGLFAEGLDPGGIAAVALAQDDRTLASRSVKGMVTLWDRTSRSQVWSKAFNDDALGNIAFAPDGKSLAWVTRTALRRLGLESRETSTMPLYGNRDRGDVAFSPDGDELTYGCRTQLMVLDLKSQHERAFAAAADEIFVVNYSPDGKLLAFGDRLGTVTLCERVTGRVLSKKDKAHPPHVYAVEFSPDGRLLATSGADSSIKLWWVRPDGLTLKKTLRGHMGYISCLAFSPDGTRLVSAAGDQTLKLWDVAHEVEVATLYGHFDYVRSARFTRDGNTIYSGGFGADHQIRFWDAPPLEGMEAKARGLAPP
jgi:WD40 repeat protein/tRNA A-37 threonylcarbamoyl transferase component Bud32